MSRSISIVFVQKRLRQTGRVGALALPTLSGHYQVCVAARKLSAVIFAVPSQRRPTRVGSSVSLRNSITRNSNCRLPTRLIG